MILFCKYSCIPLNWCYVVVDNETSEPEPEEKKAEETFLAFARVFSGTIRKGQRLYVLGPRHDPQKLLAEVGSILRYYIYLLVLGNNTDPLYTL